MKELMMQNPAVAWLLLAVIICLCFLAVICIAEIIIFPRGKSDD